MENKILGVFCLFICFYHRWTVSLPSHSQLHCSPCLGKKKSQKFYEGAAGESENFYSEGKITFQIGFI